MVHNNEDLRPEKSDNSYNIKMASAQNIIEISPSQTDIFCEPCQLRFVDNLVFEYHMSLVHGIEISDERTKPLGSLTLGKNYKKYCSCLNEW